MSSADSDLPVSEADRRIDVLYRAMRHEQQLRREAQKEANRFHALLIAERIRHLPAKQESVT